MDKVERLVLASCGLVQPMPVQSHIIFVESTAFRNGPPAPLVPHAQSHVAPPVEPQPTVSRPSRSRPKKANTATAPAAPQTKPPPAKKAKQDPRTSQDDPLEELVNNVLLDNDLFNQSAGSSDGFGFTTYPAQQYPNVQLHTPFNL